VADFDTPHVLVAVRILVDPADPEDVAAVNGVQDAGTASPQPCFAPPVHDEASLTETRQALLELARGLGGFAHAFGRKDGFWSIALYNAAAYRSAHRRQGQHQQPDRDPRP
jgi:hypothetical protein